MKKTVSLICVFALLLALCACGNKKDRSTDSDGIADAVSTENTDGAKEILKLRIIDGTDDDTVVFAGEGTGDVYTASINEMTVFTDGKQSDASALEDGMYVFADNGYELLETWPAQFANVTIHAYSRGTSKNPGGVGYDICGLYLQVLEDMWKTDISLSENVDIISVDLKNAPGELTDGEIAAIAWIFGCKHGVRALTMSKDELADNGYLEKNTQMAQASDNPDDCYWKNGILFNVTEKDGASKHEIKFDACEWRSPLGAVLFNNCTAKWSKNGTWEKYDIGESGIA